MKLSAWCKQKGIHYTTGYIWFKSGKIPHAYQEVTGSIFVEEPKNTMKPRICIYARVSNRDRKNELEYQVKRCEDFCIGRGYSVDEIFKEIASGMNDDRKVFWKMLESEPSIIVVENKDRLTRFGFNYLDRLLLKSGCEIVVLNKDENDEQDLIKDMISVVTSFCCRLYGLRRGINKSKKIKGVVNDTND